MRVVYLGHFDRSWTTETHLARELEGLGHQVDRMPEPTRATRRTLDELEARARGADLVLWTRVHPLPAEATGLWRRLEAAGTRTASWHLDLYRGLRRGYQVSRQDPFWSTGTVFTADGDPTSADWFADMGIHHVWAPAAVVSDECHPGAARPEFAHDVVFVGQRAASYPREWPWRGQLIAWLQRTYGRRFAHLGARYPVRGGDLNDLYASATVVVGDTLCPPGHSRYWSDRVYETVGRGGFLIFPRVPGIEGHFVDGEHLRLYDYGDFAGLKALIDHYLAHPAEARRIADQGQAHVRAHHTYRHRLTAALKVLGLAEEAAA